MTRPAKHTSTGEVMAHFNLSDEEWDGLPSFVRQKLATVYCQHAAAPAMYEAIRKVIEHRAKDYLDNTIEPYCSLVAALAQVDGKQ